jgi:predicted acylesterase/phospholipase RssA
VDHARRVHAAGIGAILSDTLGRQAVVFSGSGCGSADAYGVGVMKALAETGEKPGRVPFEPSIYSGSAFGAFNAAMMVADSGGGAARTVRRLEEAWLDGICSMSDRPNGVYRIRAVSQFDPRRWMESPVSAFLNTARDAAYLAGDFAARVRAHVAAHDRGGVLERVIDLFSATQLFDMSPLEGTLSACVDLRSVRSSEKALMVNATDWEGGIGRIFTNGDMTDAQGYRILQASAAYLLVFPFVDINGRPFGGGPGSLATPLRPVVDTWAPQSARLDVRAIYLQPPMPRIPVGAMPGMFSGIGRYFDMVELLNVHAEVEYGPGQAPPAGDAHGHAHVAIHRYRPSTPIVDWINTLDFDRRKTEAFIALGYRDAMNHDCRLAGCVCPD